MMSGLKIGLGVSSLALILAASPHGKAQNAMLLPTDAILGYSLDWFAASGEATVLPTEIVVYSLSCGKCIDELSAIARGYATAPDRFMLASFKKKDRDVSIPLLSLGLSNLDPKTRRSKLLDLIRIYTGDPDHYLENLEDWVTTVESHWPIGSGYKEDVLSRAFATNVLDMQARILALMDKMGTPDKIPLDQPTLALEVTRGSDRYNALVATLSLSWLRPGLETKEDAESIGKWARSIDPLKSLSASQWKELKEWAMSGGYWIWGGRLGTDILGEIIDWQAQYHLLPDDATRLEKQRKWFEGTIARAAKGSLSPLEAFGLADIEALASPAWSAAQADARQQLVFASYLGNLTTSKK